MDERQREYVRPGLWRRISQLMLHRERLSVVSSHGQDDDAPRPNSQPTTEHLQAETEMSDSTGKLLAGKTALITGAGRGLGRAFAETLAGLGANVGIHGMREEGPAEYGEGTTLTATAQEIGETHGVQSIRVLADLTQNDQVERIVGEVRMIMRGAEAMGAGWEP